MTNRLTLISLIAVLAFIASGWSCRSGSFGGEPGVFRGKLYENKKAATPKGVKVKSRDAINTALLPEIDKGLDRLFEIAAAPPNNYSGFSTHGSYTVWLFPRSPKCIDPGFLVDATGTPYDGTEWDKDPRPGYATVCAAGMLMLDEGRPGMVVADDLGQMQNVVRFEGEHNLLLEVDRERFIATMYHVGEGSAHPILGEGVAARSSASASVIEPAGGGGQPVGLRLAGKDICVLLTK